MDPVLNQEAARALLMYVGHSSTALNLLLYYPAQYVGCIFIFMLLFIFLVASWLEYERESSELTSEVLHDICQCEQKCGLYETIRSIGIEKVHSTMLFYRMSANSAQSLFQAAVQAFKSGSCMFAENC